MLAYLEQETIPAAARLGAAAQVLGNPGSGGPLLIACQDEGDGLPTVLTYGHADVVPVEPRRWRPGLDPWRVTVEQDRWYGKGTARLGNRRKRIPAVQCPSPRLGHRSASAHRGGSINGSHLPFLQ